MGIWTQAAQVPPDSKDLNFDEVTGHRHIALPVPSPVPFAKCDDSCELEYGITRLLNKVCYKLKPS